MANKVVEEADLATYTFATVGDIIIDTATSTHADGKLQINIQNGSTLFAGARNGANIWIDGDMGVFYYFRLTNGEVTEWEISDSSNYVHMRPFPGTQVRMIKNASTNSGFLMIVYDIKFLVIDGENDDYPGLRDGWGDDWVFLTGHFGFHLSGEEYPVNGHMINTKPPEVDGGFHVLRGIEASQGFSAFRYAASQFDEGDPNRTASYKVERCYVHDAGDGEGLYIGATHAGPMYLIKDFTVDDCVIARRACELVQAQLLIAPDTNAAVRNCVLYASAMDWLSAFQPGQDTTIQWSLEEGGNIIEDTIVDGGGSISLNHFGGGNIASESKSALPAIVRNCAFFRGRGIFSYSHNLTQYGVWRIIRDCYLKAFDNSYYQGGLNTLQDYYISANNGGDPYTWMNILHDAIKTTVFQNKTSYEIIDITDSASPLPDVEYMNSGAHESPNSWMNWKATYGNYHDDATVDKPVTYEAGWIVCNIEQGVEYQFYKVISTHTTTGVGALNPRQDIAANGNVRYEAITWDAAGVRSDQPAWESGDTQSIYPPDDFRLVANNFYNKKGMGLRSNPQNTDYTQYQWYRSASSDGSNPIAIPGAKALDYIVQDCDNGMYIALGIKVKDENGAFDSQFRMSAWVLVN